MPRHPKVDLPPEVAKALRPTLPEVGERIIAAVGEEVPEYKRPMEGGFGRAVRLGVDEALRRFVDEIEHGSVPHAAYREVYRELGRTEYREGRSLDALQAAYRVGARYAWRAFVDAGREAGLSDDVLYRLGEAIFAYIDELSAESVEGYAAEQSTSAGERQRLRSELARLLIQEPPPDPQVVDAAARAAAWRVPRNVCVAVAGGPDQERLASAVGPDVLWLDEGGRAALVVPDPSTARRHLIRALADRPAAVGNAVPTAEARHSARAAELAFELVLDGRIAADGAVFAEEHPLELLWHRDSRLAEDLHDRALAPLKELSPARKARLHETLRAWLDHQGRIEPTAAALGVHPQTVRYRVARLRELFGKALEDPESRLLISLALRG